MKELCVDARLLGASGIGTYIKNVLPALKESSFSLKVIADSAALEFWEPLASFEIILCPTLSNRPIQEQLKLPFVIPKCDLFWSPHYNVPLLPIRAKKRVVTIHDANSFALSSRSFVQKIYSKTMTKRAAKLSDQIITDSLFSSEELQKYTQAKQEKIHVVHLGVERKAIQVKNEESRDKFFLFVSNILPHKNLCGLIQALRFVLESGFNEYRLLVVGHKALAQKVEALLQKEPELASRVTFLGTIEDAKLTHLYQTATALVFPSFYEGFGLPPLEAMSLGCPVVVSKVASLPEVCGDCVEYVDPYDPKDIARGMISVITDTALREERIKKGLQRSLLFDWKKTGERHIEIMEQMV